MPARNYKIAEWGPAVGEGVSGARLVNVNAVAKTYSGAEPNIVANELIAARLGQALLLPIPPAFIIQDEDGKPWFTSLNFNLAGEPLPPVRPEDVVGALPGLCAGVVLFDIWIMNPDRHRRNLAHDRSTNRLEIFDHSRALMPLGGDQRHFATAHKDDLAITAPVGTHCLAPRLVDGTAFGLWFTRIRSIPDFHIRDVLEAAVDVGLRPDNVDFFQDFLMQRREDLPKLIEAHQDAFPLLDPGLGLELNWS